MKYKVNTNYSQVKKKGEIKIIEIIFDCEKRFENCITFLRINITRTLMIDI